MTEPQKDTQRALAAARLIFDGRDPSDASVMVTLEGLVTLVLLAHMGRVRAEVADRDGNLRGRLGIG